MSLNTQNRSTLATDEFTYVRLWSV